MTAWHRARDRCYHRGPLHAAPNGCDSESRRHRLHCSRSNQPRQKRCNARDTHRQRTRASLQVMDTHSPRTQRVGAQSECAAAYQCRMFCCTPPSDSKWTPRSARRTVLRRTRSARVARDTVSRRRPGAAWPRALVFWCPSRTWQCIQTRLAMVPSRNPKGMPQYCRAGCRCGRGRFHQNWTSARSGDCATGCRCHTSGHIRSSATSW